VLRSNGNLGVTLYHNPSSFHHALILDRWTWSLSGRYCFPNSKWTFSPQFSRRQDVSFVLTNSKLTGRLGWNLRRRGEALIRIDARPRLSDYRSAHLYGQWKSGVWQFGLSLVQSLHSEIATVALGWRVFSARGLEWVLSWNRGNASIQVPIVVSKGLATATFGQLLYFSVISYLIQDGIAEMWGWIGEHIAPGTAASQTSTRNIVDPAKAKKDAGVQKELMARQARRKMKDEKEKDGLIVKEAIYKVENGDKWDVTIPLQFWVYHSTLTLPGRSKSELLGFYDVAATIKEPSSVSQGSTSATSSSLAWSDVWNDLLGLSSPKGSSHRHSRESTIPTLSVSYDYKGKSYHIQIKDQQELRLPSEQATRIEASDTDR